MLNNKLQIAMLELSDQNRAVLDFYFNSAGRDIFTLVDEDKADVFITDYDYPGVKENVARLLSTSNKPIIILSIREQNLPSTIWLAKPLTSDSLTKSADSLKQMIVANTVKTKDDEVPAKAPENKTLITETRSTEAQLTEDYTVETSNVETSSVEISNNETTSGSSVDAPILARDYDLDDDEEGNIFDSLEEDQDEAEEVDVYKKIEAQLAMAGSAALASGFISSNDNSDNNIGNADAEITAKISESSHLEFADVLLDNDINAESESEVDTLLNSLMQYSQDEIKEDLVSENVISKLSDSETEIKIKIKIKMMFFLKA